MPIGYIDTRSKPAKLLNFSDVILKGIASSGGLFVPEKIPHLTKKEIAALAEMPYYMQAAYIYKAFKIDFDVEQIITLQKKSYGKNFDVEEIIPIAKVDDLYILELFHGPTSAFKDMALQCMPNFFEASIKDEKERKNNDTNYLICVATSGDTGKAALEGYKDKEGVKIIVFYPNHGVSDIQFKQMATQTGDNVCVVALNGNFDDCQNAVKQIFSDKTFNKLLEKKFNTKLSSANSINWARLMPQIVYYISAYSKLLAAGEIASREKIDVCVPTGNFGNILACWYAKKMGIPIEHIVCASNENNVLFDFINSGHYTIKDRDFIKTCSPSMDILISSNLERQLFELCGHDYTQVKAWMKQLNTKKEFVIDTDTFKALSKDFSAGYCDQKQCLASIKHLYDSCSYLMDPHTACAYNVAKVHKGPNKMLIASTAHWSKFGPDVYRAIHGMQPNQILPQEICAMSGVELNMHLAKELKIKYIPNNIKSLLKAPIRFTKSIDNDVQKIKEEIVEFLMK
ncbi:MAG: threonine synthase [Coriobacteriales bacterium]|nr:threonine synthase [Coriobacteriales bacterium]